MFLQALVILSTGSVCLPREQTPPEQTTPGEDTFPQEQPHPPGAHPPSWSKPPPGTRLRHTVNERPVRILLECILVIDYGLVH